VVVRIEHRGLKARAWARLPSCPVYLEVLAGEHDWRCDGSLLKGLTAPTAVLYMMRWKSLMASYDRTMCTTLWYGEKPDAIARQLDFCYLFI
jgi:hypothetical protein